MRRSSLVAPTFEIGPHNIRIYIAVSNFHNIESACFWLNTRFTCVAECAMKGRKGKGSDGRRGRYMCILRLMMNPLFFWFHVAKNHNVVIASQLLFLDIIIKAILLTHHSKYCIPNTICDYICLPFTVRREFSGSCEKDRDILELFYH